MKPSALLQSRWDSLSTRERSGVLMALGLLLVALLWWVGVAPALNTLRRAAQQAPQLQAQLQQMQGLQLQAKALQAQPRITPAEARRLLEGSVKLLGPTAQLSLSGERATLSLKGVAPDALAQWLTQARLNAHALPSEAHLVRGASGAWDGSLVLSLGAH